MTHKNVNEQAWKEIHAAARAEFPDPLNDRRRKEPGRAWLFRWGQRNGRVTPSTPETARASTAAVNRFKASEAQAAREAANIERNQNDKARRTKEIQAGANLAHAQEANIRQARHIRAGRSNLFDTLHVLFWIAFFVGWFMLMKGCAL